ncbi:hypothetical protein pb186bvf_010480 [Paramecium bursaria]
MLCMIEDHEQRQINMSIHSLQRQKSRKSWHQLTQQFHILDHIELYEFINDKLKKGQGIQGFANRTIQLDIDPLLQIIKELGGSLMNITNLTDYFEQLFQSIQIQQSSLELKKNLIQLILQKYIKHANEYQQIGW